ncbi:bile acid:sodium symporter family protein [Adhaeribacter soli]|uniref:Bile acid:sodium symporter n=1 Tax=Adhaeribacter soli TaxID=2607655 RepID=A0A5N1IKP5_9BACT|nr:bile acid:sodium symporter family protein [Adhaeribacter soli]KAA9325234.1 bile acid:sodium symporter [Adhaeribacter soli]
MQNRFPRIDPDPVDKQISAFQRAVNIAGRAGLDPFILILVGVIVLAKFWPEPGIQEGPLSLTELANYGVSFIFFFYGLRQEPEKLKAGLSNWRLHLVVHLTTFVVFPLLALAGKSLFQTPDSEVMWLGIFFQATLPSTVSSAVVMVSIAGGNIPAAIFNASISSTLGVFITPLWMGLFLNTAESSFDLSQVFTKLIIQVIIPVILGMLLHKTFGKFAEKHRARMRYFDQLIILTIVYTSFSESFSQNMFRDFSLTDIFLLGLGMVGFFLAVFFLINLISRLLGFNREDRITAIFCGSKKSLVHGTVMAKVLFANSVNTGIILLPVMLYHTLQLVAGSILAQKFAREKED